MEDEVLGHMRWPIPVICRDVDYYHRSETRLMLPDDLRDFLQDELYGEDWNEMEVEAML